MPHVRTIEGRISVGVPGEPVSLFTGVDSRYVGAPMFATLLVVTAHEDNDKIVLLGGPYVDATLATRQGRPMHAGAQQIYTDRCIDSIRMDGLVIGDGVYWSADVEWPDAV